MAKKKSRMFPRRPTKKEIKEWTNKVIDEGLDINEVPEDIRTYIAILMGV